VDPRRLGRLWHLGHRDDGHRVEPKPDRPVAPHQGQALVATDIDPHLTPAERLGSAISVFFYLAAILVVCGRAAGREERRYRWGIWALVLLLLN